MRKVAGLPDALKAYAYLLSKEKDLRPLLRGITRCCCKSVAIKRVPSRAECILSGAPVGIRHRTHARLCCTARQAARRSASTRRRIPVTKAGKSPVVTIRS
jgi:hypothetical protein